MIIRKLKSKFNKLLFKNKKEHSNTNDLEREACSMYKALDIAKYIVSKCENDGCAISNLQLQKILYCIQRDFVKKYNKPFFADSIEAWQFGPVVPIVYYHYCGSGSMPLFNKSVVITFNYSDKKFIDTIIEEKRVLPPWDLVSETHQPNGAWDKIYKDGSGNRNKIPLELIKDIG